MGDYIANPQEFYTSLVYLDAMRDDEIVFF